MAAKFTRKEVAARNHKHDAAIIIDNVVYDVTPFLEDHPGGVEILLDNAGRDASKCFRDVGHGEEARRWREQFRVGDVVQEEWREVLARGTSSSPSSDEGAAGDAGGTGDGLTLAGLVSLFASPLGAALMAIVLYYYLF